jgi:hypothetical protein
MTHRDERKMRRDQPAHPPCRIGSQADRRSMGRRCAQNTRFGSGSRLVRSARSGHPIWLDWIRERFDHSGSLITVLEECLA